MRSRVVTRAPGKLFLMGEYAVLDGCPAVVAAIDRTVEVRLELSATGAGIRIQSALATADLPAKVPPVAPGPLRFVTAALRAGLSECPQLLRRQLTLTIVSRLDEVDGSKLGLGSSAAVTVAVIAAIFAAARKSLEDRHRDRLFALALGAHRQAQDGLGSGADVAASVYGGTSLFRPQEGVPQITPLTLPNDARLLVGWSGEPASTSALVQRYHEARNGTAGKRAAFVQASRAAVNDFVAALACGSLSLDAVRANGQLLEQLASDLKLAVLTARLRQLVGIARREGAGAKISGAGGGDCGIALTRDAETAQRIRAAWRAAGLTPLDLRIASQGVTSGLC